jgi:hypothetical protein
MAANTTIQILRSYANTAPGNLADGELAYSFLSNTLFIGSSTLNVESQLWTNNIISIGGSDLNPFNIKRITTWQAQIQH